MIRDDLYELSFCRRDWEDLDCVYYKILNSCILDYVSIEDIESLTSVLDKIEISIIERARLLEMKLIERNY